MYIYRKSIFKKILCIFSIMQNFTLKYEFDDINQDSSLLSFTLKLESENGKINFIVANNIEYVVEGCHQFNITKGGHNYWDNIDEEKNIQTFLKKIKERKFPSKYSYNYDYCSEYSIVREAMEGLCDLHIEIDEEKTTINGSYVPTSKSLIESIIEFFNKIFMERDKYKEEYLG